MSATKTTAITLAEKQPAALLPINNVQELQFLGTVLAQSQLFGQSNPAEGLAIVAMCHQKRISWMDFMGNFHMIKGRVSKKADAILADFHMIGGTHIPISRTEEVAEAKFTVGKTSYTSKLTWEECKHEPFIYQGKEEDVIKLLEAGNMDALKIKAKYRTPRARKQMLWARVVSDGVRVLAPECCRGIYTPEEVGDFVEPDTVSVSPMPVVQTAAAPVASAVDVEVCPVGPATGKRWDDETVFSLDTLKQALNGTHEKLTPEMKDYIRGLIEKREPIAQKVEIPEVVNG